MSSEGFLKEMQTIGEKFLLKLQKLPKADPVEIVSFCVVLLFIEDTKPETECHSCTQFSGNQYASDKPIYSPLVTARSLLLLRVGMAWKE
ncbi:small integral membrane protein 5 [Limosa lapponica baueri]|uniref:Small integral membrane protein 5 n=1 Tax=Limosa lapponica baueri TaxID=1758121 RepID=A0A2I0T117_LIMLA|nr:small integral membrane protein 5 [Limosa lapponica baueri]